MSDQPTGPGLKLSALNAMALRAVQGIGLHEDTPEWRAKLVSEAVGSPSDDGGVVELLRFGLAPLSWRVGGFEINALLRAFKASRIVLDPNGQILMEMPVDLARAGMVLARSGASRGLGCKWTLNVTAKPLAGEFLWRFTTPHLATSVCFDGPSIEAGLDAIEAARLRQDLDSSVRAAEPGPRHDIDDRD